MKFSDRGTVLRGDLTGGPYGGGDEIDWSSPTETDYPAVLQPASTSEDVVAQQRVETRWDLFLPTYADMVAATDRWRSAEGDVYEVDGEVVLWKNLDARPTYKFAKLVRVSGG